MVSDKMMHKAFRAHKTLFMKQNQLQKYFSFPSLSELYIGFNDSTKMLKSYAHNKRILMSSKGHMRQEPNFKDLTTLHQPYCPILGLLQRGNKPLAPVVSKCLQIYTNASSFHSGNISIEK